MYPGLKPGVTNRASLRGLMHEVLPGFISFETPLTIFGA
jgi:hypothetical protein